jgi:hypothetical protein
MNLIVETSPFNPVHSTATRRRGERTSFGFIVAVCAIFATEHNFIAKMFNFVVFPIPVPPHARGSKQATERECR